jgi:Tol biopolymer transport system component
LLLSFSSLSAQLGISEICPSTGIQARPAEFQPDGIILTAFDGESMWVYDIARDTRYPLPDTRPCMANCHLSPDAGWLTYLDYRAESFGKMRLDGTQRSLLAAEASDVWWWNNDTLLIWEPVQGAYLRGESETLSSAQILPTRNVRSIQANGLWALAVESRDGEFIRTMINLENRDTVDEQRVLLAPDRPYFNAASWSPDGRFLAYVGRGAYDDSVGIAGGELYLASPNSAIPQQMTFLFNAYGAVRINGYAPDDLSWSPDGTQIAFWVIELLGSDPEVNTGTAVLHLLDIRTSEVRRYCAFSTIEHTPETPRIVWSPDSTHIAFAGNVPGDNKGSLLLAVDVESGIFTELSDGIFPVYGIPQVIAWGYAP